MPYYGSKGRMATQIAALLPAHVHYIEAFAGSLAVLLAKRPARLETVNDLDGDIVTFWRVLRDNPQALDTAILCTPHSREEYLDCREPMPEDVSDVERARRVFVQLVQGRMGTMARTGWRFDVNASSGATYGMDEIDRFRGRMAAVAERIRKVQIENMPALDLIARYGTDPQNLVYADPPYLLDTRSSAGYRHEMTDESQHRELAETLRACKASVVLSGYRSPLYDELYEGWYVEEWPTVTMNGGKRKATCEVLWSNRPLGNRIQDRLFEV